MDKYEYGEMVIWYLTGETEKLNIYLSATLSKISYKTSSDQIRAPVMENKILPH